MAPLRLPLPSDGRQRGNTLRQASDYRIENLVQPFAARILAERFENSRIVLAGGVLFRQSTTIGHMDWSRVGASAGEAHNHDRNRPPIANISFGSGTAVTHCTNVLGTI